MVLRWVGAAVAEAEKGFRRLKGHWGMPSLLAALRKNDALLARNSSSKRQSEELPHVQENAA